MLERTRPRSRPLVQCGLCRNTAPAASLAVTWLVPWKPKEVVVSQLWFPTYTPMPTMVLVPWVSLGG